MKHFLIFAVAVLLGGPAFAQDEATPVNPEGPRLELAAKMHEIWPVSTRVEEAIAIVAEDVPDSEREAFKARMRKAIDQKKLEQESINAMAASFSEAELQAMVNFYGSAEGRSVSAKTEDYMKRLQPVMVKMLDSALLKMRTGEPLQSTPPATPQPTP